MAQEINVLQCFDCCTYQAQIVKKSKKWSCVVCGQKQSLKKCFGTGSGKECRELVQKLNSMRDTSVCIDRATSQSNEIIRSENSGVQELPENTELLQNIKEIGAVKRISKWDKYLEKEESEDESIG